MFRNVSAIRTLCNLTCGALLLTTQGMGQDRSPDVRSITLEEAKTKAAGKAAISNVALLGIDAAKYHRQATQADYFPKLSADFVNLHYNKFMETRSNWSAGERGNQFLQGMYLFLERIGLRFR